MKQCERCRQPAVSGERYCAKCKKDVLKELEAAGLLDKKPWGGIARGGDAREDTRDTKRGLDR